MTELLFSDGSYKYRKPELQEALFNLYEQGKEVFGTYLLFSDWLNQENIYFDSKKPSEFLNTVDNVNIIADHLYVIKYGDLWN